MMHPRTPSDISRESGSNLPNLMQRGNQGMRKPLGRVDGTEQLETLVCGLQQTERILGTFRQPRMCQPNFRGEDLDRFSGNDLRRLLDSTLVGILAPQKKYFAPLPPSRRHPPGAPCATSSADKPSNPLPRLKFQ